MRSNEERIALMHQRAAQMKKEENDRTVRIMQGTGLCLALAAVILLACFMPRFTQLGVQGSIPAGMNASIFTQKEALGFIDFNRIISHKYHLFLSAEILLANESSSTVRIAIASPVCALTTNTFATINSPTTSAGIPSCSSRIENTAMIPPGTLGQAMLSCVTTRINTRICVSDSGVP